MEPPKYVKLEDSGTAFRLRGDLYYRDGGNWHLGYKFVDGEFLSWMPRMRRLHRIKLIEITKEEWELDNRGYV